MESCAKHPHERGVALCRRCGASWCGDCLVYAFGPKKPPYCMGCAMVAGGVRSAAARPAMSRKELKARRKQVRAAAKAPQAPEQVEPDGAPAEPEPAVAMTEAAPDAPAPTVTDWATPWWEDRQPTLAD